jgi:hypothetical protein
MSIFYPDNDKRQQRLSQLSTDASDYLAQSQATYQSFVDIISRINARIAEAYRTAGMTPPGEFELDILAAANVPVSGVINKIRIATPILDVVGFVLMTRYLAPGMLSRLVATGVVSEELAAATFVTAWGGEVAVGVLISGVAVAIVAGVVIAAIGLAIDLFEGSELRSELRRGIIKLCAIRAEIFLHFLRSGKLVDSMRAAERALEGLAAEGRLTPTAVDNMIRNFVEPAVHNVEGIVMATALYDLAQMDADRDAWTAEDAVPPQPLPPPSSGPMPIFVVQLAESDPPFIPGIPGGDLRLCPAVPGDPAVRGRSTRTERYPTIRKGDLTVWPFSFADHRSSIFVAAFNKSGTMVNSWTLNGISNVARIHADPNTNMICFTEEGGNLVHMAWSQIVPAPQPLPMKGDIQDVLEFGPEKTDFGLVNAEVGEDRRQHLGRPLFLRNKTNGPLVVRLQVVSALAADRDPNNTPPAVPPKPAVVSLYMALVYQITVPPNSISELQMTASFLRQAGWIIYSPSQFKGGVAAEADGYAGAIVTRFEGLMYGGHVKIGAGGYVGLSDNDIPPFEFLS